MKKRVLIAAANADACRILSGFIDENLYEVSTATDGMTVRNIDVSDFSVIFLSMPLSNETGVELIRDLRSRTEATLITLVKEEKAEIIGKKIEPCGAYIVTKPVFKGSLMQAIRFCETHAKNEKALRQEIAALEEKLSEQKIVARAKLLLIEKQDMTEEEAHKYIQQQAMNRRLTQREIAEEIIGEAERL